MFLHANDANDSDAITVLSKYIPTSSDNTSVPVWSPLTDNPLPPLSRSTVACLSSFPEARGLLLLYSPLSSYSVTFKRLPFWRFKFFFLYWQLAAPALFHLPFSTGFDWVTGHLLAWTTPVSHLEKLESCLPHNSCFSPFCSSFLHSARLLVLSPVPEKSA